MLQKNEATLRCVYFLCGPLPLFLIRSCDGGACVVTVFLVKSLDPVICSDGAMLEGVGDTMFFCKESFFCGVFTA